MGFLRAPWRIKKKSFALYGAQYSMGFTWRSHMLTFSYMHFVYVIRSEVDKSWYIGYSQDVFKRLEDHNLGRNVSTRSKKPYNLIYFEAYLDKYDALGREGFLKSGSGRKFLKKQLFHYLSSNEN